MLALFFMFYLSGVNIESAVYTAHFNRFLVMNRQFKRYDETECEIYPHFLSRALRWFEVITYSNEFMFFFL